MSHYDLAKPGSEELVIACVQMEPHIGAKRANVARLIRHVETAASQGASLVVLPELATTGYVFADRDEAFSLAEGLPDGETAGLFAETAQRLGIHIVTGIAERAGKRLYNSALFTGPSGHIGIYRKLHLWNNENRFFEPGDRGVPVFGTPLGRIAIAICYDGWFPETYRLAAGVVVQPDALAEQDRHDVQVDLVDQSQLEQLTADGGREHLEVLAAGRR